MDQRIAQEKLRQKEIENDEYEKLLRERRRTKEIMNDELELQMHNDQRQLRLSEARFNEEKNQIYLPHHKRKLETDDEASRKQIEMDLEVRRVREINVYSDQQAHQREMEKMRLSTACQVQLIQASSSSNVNGAIMNRAQTVSVNNAEASTDYDEDNAAYA